MFNFSRFREWFHPDIMECRSYGHEHNFRCFQFIADDGKKVRDTLLCFMQAVSCFWVCRQSIGVRWSEMSLYTNDEEMPDFYRLAHNSFPTVDDVEDTEDMQFFGSRDIPFLRQVMVGPKIIRTRFLTSQECIFIIRFAETNSAYLYISHEYLSTFYDTVNSRTYTRHKNYPYKWLNSLKIEELELRV